MKTRTHLYVSRKNVLTWLMALCMAASAVARIAFSGLKGPGDATYLWSQILLPIAATTLYALIALLNGETLFYKTAIPVWMMAFYSGLWISGNVESRMMVWLFWVALIFFAVLYTDITAGHHAILFLLPIVCVPIVILLYFYRGSLMKGDILGMKDCLADFLALAGVFFVCFAVRIHPAGEYHRTWGDRPDGRKVRSLPAMAQMEPYIMVTRNTSSNLFEDSIEITQIDRYIRQKRREGLTNFGITHVLLACYVRALCRYPGLNRFISGQKIYSRGDDIQYCMTIKKEMTSSSPDTVIKVHLNPRDTSADVYRKLQDAVDTVKNSPLDSSFDNTAAAFTMIPGVLLKFAVWGLKTLDYFGLLPGFLLEVSPFHGSVFFTSMGSLGIPAINHHLYNFGNMPVFIAFGKKYRRNELNRDGTIVTKKYVDMGFTLDERICDGFYYASVLKYLKRIFNDPARLDVPPETVVQDIP